MIERERVNKVMTILLKVLFSTLFVVLFFSVMAIEATKKPQKEIDAELTELRANLELLAAGGEVKNPEGYDWPPKMNKLYPDLDLLDKEGRSFKISDLKGYVVVMSYVDMSSPTCQAQAGAAAAGKFGTTIDVDKYSEPFTETLRKNSLEGFTLPNDGVLEIYVLIYNQDGSQPSLDSADEWSGHFNLDLSKGVIVAVPKKSMQNKRTDSVICGYQLIDKNRMLRVDSAGPEPKHNLKMTLVPLLPKLLR